MEIAYILGGLIAGIVAGYFISKSTLGKQHEQEKQKAELEAKSILQDAKREAETIKKDKILEAKETFLQKKAEYDEFVNNKSRKLDEREKNVKDRENKLREEKTAFNRIEKEVNEDKEKIAIQKEVMSAKQAEMDKAIDENRRKLEGIAKLTQEEAKAQLIESLKEEAKTQSLAYIKEIMDEAKSKANKESKKIILQTIQRTAAEQAIENTVSVFQLESDDQKGQIIGREGRNIRALESATGVEIIVDDTPEAIIISGFDAVRREVARLSLQRLVSDGRIHPARIEEVVAKTRKQIDEQIQEIGDRTIIDLGIHGLHRELVKLVGKMRFRSSYGQNLLQHSREVANLCATMAAELGIKPALAKRAGLLHDIGKVSEDDPEASHALLGMALCEKYNEHPAVVNAVGAHHDEIEMTAIISPIVQACDAISGSRPGARRETLENYIQRIKELETLAGSYEGVQKAFAMQAGRELRVIVESGEVTDEQSDMLAFQIADKIQNEMVYPGQIKVTVIREKRAVGYAK